MAFPTIPTTGASTILTGVQANTTAARTFPSLGSLTKNAGDLLIAIAVGYQTTAASGSAWGTWGGGFTEFVDQAVASNMTIGAAYKFSTGSETGTFTVTQAATITGHAALILMSISGNHATSPPEATAIASGTTSAADPPSLSPSWGADDTLWIAVRGCGETSTSGTFTGLGTPATNYSNGVQTGISADAVGGLEAGTAFRQLTAASENVDNSGVCDVSNARNVALTIAVRPTPPITVDQIMTGYARGVNPRAY